MLVLAFSARDHVTNPDRLPAVAARAFSNNREHFSARWGSLRSATTHLTIASGSITGTFFHTESARNLVRLDRGLVISRGRTDDS